MAKNLQLSAWKLGNDLHIVDVGEGLYLFRFKLESQLQWVQDNGPVTNPEGDSFMVAFKYERLVGLCYACGHLGHEKKNCTLHDPSPEQ